jgi:glycosyltransferase involved in cell wall biosynthesis
MTMDFWIVIPAYSEALRLPPYLRLLGQALHGAPFKARIQVVDDGSPLAERIALEAAINEFRHECPFLNPLHVLPLNRGKGAAIRAGWQLAPSDCPHLAFIDADGSIPASEVVRVLASIPTTSGHAYFASRRRVPGRIVKRNEFRHVIGRIFAFLVTLLFRQGIHDSQCGFKCVPHRSYRRIQIKLREDRFVFDVELLVMLCATGCKVIEIPIDWKHTPGGKVCLLRDAPAMVLGLVKIRIRSRNHAPSDRGI